MTTCKVEEILFKFEKSKDCIIASVTTKERFHYAKAMTSKIQYQKNRIFETKYKQR